MDRRGCHASVTLTPAFCLLLVSQTTDLAVAVLMTSDHAGRGLASTRFSVVSLARVSPGAATDGVTPIFSEKNLISHHRLSAVSSAMLSLFIFS